MLLCYAFILGSCCSNSVMGAHCFILSTFLCHYPNKFRKHCKFRITTHTLSEDFHSGLICFILCVTLFVFDSVILRRCHSACNWDLNLCTNDKSFFGVFGQVNVIDRANMPHLLFTVGFSRQTMFILNTRFCNYYSKCIFVMLNFAWFFGRRLT